MLLAGAPLPEAQNLFGRLREEAAEYSEHELGFRLSLSAGAASFLSDGGDPNGLLEAADTVMYRRNVRGRIGFTTGSWAPAEGEPDSRR